MKTVEILEKYNISIKLNITDVNDILLMYKKESRYITDNGINKIISNIENDDNNVILLQCPIDTGKSTALVKICKSIKK